MLKMAKGEASIKDDPKVLDRANWQDIRVLVDNEAIHPDWRTALYRLHRTGKINNDQREAGDKYTTLIRDYRKLWTDPMSRFMVYDKYENNSDQVRSLVQFGLGHVAGDAIDPETEFETKRAKRIGARYKEAAAMAGPARSILEDLLIDDIWPIGERGQREIGHALTRLSHFFNTGTKRKR
jgi:hypothetical protein